ncbi:MAG: thiamine pyrophosphate-binding protein [Candidatus Lokiarchaeota archaeon]|nr:thiamine pyrophosphate-binding protein [Candidatus Lokiarchaeota archaeon]
MEFLSEEKKKINGGDVLIKALLNEGVEYLFGIPGGQFLNMYDAIYQWGEEKGIQTILFRHEQAAAHAADAYARVTNKPGICFGTVGPGALHLVPGIGTAWSDNIPILAIVPQVNSQFDDTFTLQGNLDQITMFKPITKFQRSIRDVNKIPDAIEKCFRQATGGRPRPVLLEIYEDAFLEEIDEDELKIPPPEKYRAQVKPGIDPNSLSKALDMLLTAEKPVIISGGGVMLAEAWEELRKFAEYFKIPVMTTHRGVGTISIDSECFIGSTITVSSALHAASNSDVILALGCKFSYCLGHGEEPFWNDDQKLIQVDIDPTIIGRAKPIELGIVADCKIFLKQLLDAANKKERVQSRDWLDSLQDLHEKYKKSIMRKATKDKVPILPQRLIKEMYEFMDEDAILIMDGGDIACFGLEQVNLYKPRKPLSLVQAIGMGHLGTAVPYCIGAKLGQPDKQVIALAGDGSFMINVQDLETASRLNLDNLIIVVANNNAWGMIKSGQKLFKGKRYIDVDLPEFDYAKCAEGFGCYGEVVTEPNEIKPALERAKKSGKPAVLDAKISFEIPDATKLMGSMGIL